jgi:cytochrome c5
MRTRFLLPILLAGLATACSGDKKEGGKSEGGGAAQAGNPLTDNPAPGTPAAEAKQVFESRCSTCHGAQGMGDGPAGAALNPKPRNFHDQEWQKSVDDDHIAKTIVEGGAAVGKSPLMVPNPDLKDKPEVVKGLVQIVRAFGKS